MITLEIIVGPMFSGKSTELLRRCSTYSAIGKNVTVINHSLDSRCGNEIKTHSQHTLGAIKTDSLLNIKFDEMPDVIAIDESQFFGDLYDFIVKFEKKSVIILVAGLDGDFQRKPFGQILNLIPIAESITKLQSMCSICKNGVKASFTKRLKNNNSEQICIGSLDKYISVCRYHYFE